MENKMILVDTTILIDFFRKTDKSNSRLIHLVDEGYQFSISAITAYEIFSGATSVQMNFWNEFLLRIKIYSFESSTVKNAVLINQQLKKKRKQIDIADLFIAATAFTLKLPLATLNKKHFERVENLTII